jgi:hypothetical protein
MKIIITELPPPAPFVASQGSRKRQPISVGTARPSPWNDNWPWFSNKRPTNSKTWTLRNYRPKTVNERSQP